MTTRFRVALTFDAEHPDRRHHAGGDERVVAALDKSAVRATFFLQGRWVEANRDLAQRIAAGGHLVGSHSHYHARASLFSDDGLRTDVRDAEAAIRRATGSDPRPWFRLPFGSGATRPSVIARLADLGYRHVGWHVDVAEWRARQAPAVVRDRIVDAVVAHGDGAIVLLHTWPDPVGHAVPGVIDRLQAAGARFVRVDDLDLPTGLEPIAEPRPAPGMAN